MRNKNIIKKVIFFAIVLALLSTCRQTVREYYLENGAIADKYEVIPFTKIRDGYYQTYNPDGTLVFDGNYKRDKLHKKCTSYYDNGQLEYTVIYDEGRLVTVLNYFDINGNKLDFGKVVNGNGYIKKYNKTGKLREEGEIKNGLREGKWKTYSNAGFFEYVQYKNGIREGNTFVSIPF